MRSERTLAGVTSAASMEARLYADLLSRFERCLAYASTLQTRLRRHERERERLEKLGKENHRLKARIGLDDFYIALLEQALESAGLLPGPKQPAIRIETMRPEGRAMAGQRRLRLAGMPRRQALP